MGQKVGATTSCYTGFDLDDALRGISKAGLNYVELSAMFIPCDTKADIAEHVVPEKMSHDDIKCLETTLRQHSLSPMSISGHSDLVKSEGVGALRKRIDLAKRIGAKIVNTKAGDPSSEEDVRSFYKNVSDLAEYAADKGVIVALETGGAFCSNGKEAVRILQKIDSEYIRLNYDTANVIYYVDTKPEEDIEHTIDYLVHVHVKDKRGGKGVYDFPALGKGNIDFVKIFDILSRHNYNGPLSIEIEFDGKRNESLDDVDKAVKESCQFLKQFVQF